MLRILSCSFASLLLLAPTGCDGAAAAGDGDGDGDGDDPGDGDGDGDVDAGPEDPVGEAMVYLEDPITDGNETAKVVLVPPTSSDGSLTSDSVNALNCLNKPGGASVFGFATLCVEEKSVFPDENGDYLHVVPPADTNDGEDPFAELMMYHHVNAVHDYFNGTHGFTDLDFPLDAVANITINLGGNWQSFPNAAFIPSASFAAFGLPERDFGAIMFGQGDGTDFSYDATVIYHEYTHAVIGPERLNATFVDGQGLNNIPGALNEGLADYFASTIVDDPNLGRYALGAQMRDLAAPRRCPDHLTTEIHADGKIIATALWAFRGAVGAAVADRVVFAATMQSTQTTSLETFGELLLDAAADEEAGVEDTLAGILSDHGVLTCARIKPWIVTNFAFSAEGVPHSVEGKGSINLPGGVPGYHQWSVAREGETKIVLDWSVQAGGFFGGAAQPVDLAVRVAGPIAVALNGSITADAIIPVALGEDGTTQQIALDGACLPAAGETMHVMFVNNGQNASAITRMGISRVDTIPDGVAIATCD